MSYFKNKFISEILETVRRLRKEQTKEEKILWNLLRNRKLEGKKFLRQYAIIYESKSNEHFVFVADFYCCEEKLILELDGKIHEYQKEQDKHRDEILKTQGLRILRVKNEELTDIKRIKEKIKANFRSS